ncbi:MAG TPA: hypothetical protein P5165_07260, partial [Spirochaetia bacterium]|nr:hypothetical protein [Spirochaetia bacterium]
EGELRGHVAVGEEEELVAPPAHARGAIALPRLGEGEGLPVQEGEGIRRGRLEPEESRWQT